MGMEQGSGMKQGLGTGLEHWGITCVCNFLVLKEDLLYIYIAKLHKTGKWLP